MNIKEVCKMYGVTEKNKAMKDTEKATRILERILKCKKCGNTSKWVEGTNACYCPDCKKKITLEKDKKAEVSLFHTVCERDRMFLENNYYLMLNKENNHGVKKEEA